MRKIVIHQPLFFPWVGMFEQLRLADVYLHYDDAPITRSGGVVNRIKVKTANGSVWMTAPITRKGDVEIRDVQIRNDRNWCKKHLRCLEQSYARSPHVHDMLDIVNEIYSQQHDRLAALNIRALERVAAYFGLAPEFRLTSELAARSTGSTKVLELVNLVRGDVYITGHGARNYLDHQSFEERGVRVEYMDYKRKPYPQLHGEFDPHVSILDLIANMGPGGREVICSESIHWKRFLRQGAP